MSPTAPTPQEERRQRLQEQRRAQGLPAKISDPAALASLAAILRRGDR